MNEIQKATIELIMKTLIDLPPHLRKDVIDAVQYNEKFCWHCGVDDPNCQCWNDA